MRGMLILAGYAPLPAAVIPRVHRNPPNEATLPHRARFGRPDAHGDLAKALQRVRIAAGLTAPAIFAMARSMGAVGWGRCPPVAASQCRRLMAMRGGEGHAARAGCSLNAVWAHHTAFGRTEHGAIAYPAPPGESVPGWAGTCAQNARIWGPGDQHPGGSRFREHPRNDHALMAAAGVQGEHHKRMVESRLLSEQLRTSPRRWRRCGRAR